MSLLAQRRCSSPRRTSFSHGGVDGERRFGVYPRSGALCADDPSGCCSGVGGRATADGGTAANTAPWHSIRLLYTARRGGKVGAELSLIRPDAVHRLREIAREIASVDERLGDRLHLIDRDNDGIVDVEEIRDALAAIALRQNKFREDPEALEAFIQVALREIDANSDDVITVEEVEKWFDSLEEEVEDQ